jgi:predicted transcriptional regulator
MAGRKPTIEKIDVLNAIATAKAPFLGTKEIADELGMSKRGILNWLDDLEEEGLLHKREIGKSMIWWLSQEGREYLYEESSDAGS